ncbi:MAG: 16S rRNA (guanine(966)-N(2))-methyltransferase RsmD [Dethiobacteria bacterium]
MRIIGGLCRGIKIKAPQHKDVRPTPDMVREALFDIIGDRIQDRNFIDLFAGSGAVGIEALSRSAKSCIFIEKNFLCVKIINENLKNTGLSSRATVLNADVMSGLKKLSKKITGVSYVFLDPPYNSSMIPEVLKGIHCSALLLPEGLAIVEHHKKKEIWAENWALVSRRDYGETALSFLKMEQ